MTKGPWKALAACGTALAVLIGSQAAAATGLTAVWANEGGDKVLRHERRAERGPPRNSVWDGTGVRVWGARNEVVNFALILESAPGARAVSVSLDRLVAPNGAAISSPARPVQGNAIFDYVGRNIEVFVVDYLQILGLSRLSYENYDERHVPSKMRVPNLDPYWGTPAGGWPDRPGADKYFPEIATPHELKPVFDIVPGENQTVWIDVYVPKDATAGTYSGEIVIREQGQESRRVPVALTVRDFALPDTPAARTMVHFGAYDISERYTGQRWAYPGSPEYARALPVLQNHWKQLHRHKLTPVADPTESELPVAQDTVDRLQGRLYTAANGYDGPGVGVGDDVYGVGFYGNWHWKNGDQAEFNRRTDAWENWFRQHAPHVERFLYLQDEPNLDDPEQVAQLNGWLDKLQANPGPGRELRTFVTTSTLNAMAKLPRVDITGNWYSVADPTAWTPVVERFLAGGPRKAQYQYNGKRPASGSFAIEDDGTAPRMIPWAQWKMGVARWYYWESTYYYDFQIKGIRQNVWTTANTYGGDSYFDPVRGRTGYNYANGDGVLFYPGTDTQYPEVSLGVNGPIASLRLKYWRRGIQDADYLALANAVDPAATRAVVQRMVPRVLWGTGVQVGWDPSWLLGEVSWPVDPDAWERARGELAAIIERRPTTGEAQAPAAGPTPAPVAAPEPAPAPAASPLPAPGPAKPIGDATQIFAGG
jgi:hypothetical protein